MSTATQTAPTKRIGDLHFDHMEWLNALRFYKEDIGILEHRLEDIVKRNTKTEVMAELEHAFRFNDAVLRHLTAWEVMR